MERATPTATADTGRGERATPTPTVGVTIPDFSEDQALPAWLRTAFISTDGQTVIYGTLTDTTGLAFMRDNENTLIGAITAGP